jgi:hypothetical protein
VKDAVDSLERGQELPAAGDVGDRHPHPRRLEQVGDRLAGNRGAEEPGANHDGDGLARERFRHAREEGRAKRLVLHDARRHVGGQQAG